MLVAGAAREFLHLFFGGIWSFALAASGSAKSKVPALERPIGAKLDEAERTQPPHLVMQEQKDALPSKEMLRLERSMRRTDEAQHGAQ